MKIKIENDEHTFIDETRIIYKNNKYTQYLFGLIDEYVKKNNSNVMLYDNNGEAINKKELTITKVSDIQNIKQMISMSAKSIYKNYLMETINENDKMFLSIYQALESLQDCFTDIGFIKVKKILFKGINTDFNFDKNKVGVKGIINMFELDLEELTDCEVCIIYLNLFIKINQDRHIIINFSNIDIDATLVKWISKLDNNIQVFVSNDSISDIKLFNNSDFYLLVMNEKNYIENVYINKKHFELFLFALLPIISNNIQYLSEKIININKLYSKNSENILVKFEQQVLETTCT